MIETDDLSVAKRLIRTSHSANSRNIKFDLSFKKMKKLLSTKRCFFTRKLLNREEENHEDYLTLDRVDSSKGYTDDNVVVCGKEFNRRKYNLTPKEIEQMYKGLKKLNLV